ncbi:hypothetical protein D9619_013469 [Psilocybe cf. subviscida]|uniref:Uncharacterized protein n=1 Tax=Psilocybe cf. subviscida TaxID=2480587 RepID=A0A8H5F903_9AGAR|nr:hypothetical protein D9619_013469 [Psilocybe cf. subviscida]
MAPSRTDDDWPDSNSDDSLSQVEPTMLLGVSGGAVKTEAVRIDTAVSRIGGLSALLPLRESPLELSYYTSCARPMDLLVGCQRNDRSIRTNAAYAQSQKLAKKHVRQAQRKRDRAKAEERLRREKQRGEMLGNVNPFAVKRMGAKAASTMPAFGAVFGIDARIFSEVPAPVRTKTQTALAATSTSDSTWKVVPSYPPFYLSTTSEYILPELRPKVPRDALVDALLDDDDGK